MSDEVSELLFVIGENPAIQYSKVAHSENFLVHI